ncbi:hypothetical protein ACS0TY_026287 [Phlomoides rotata]
MVGSGTVCVVGELATYNLQSYSFKSCNSYVEYPCSVKPLVLQGSKIRLTRSSRRRTRTRSLVIRGNLGGQYEDNFEDVQRQMLDFFTYKAVRTVMNQLNEKNPTQYRWFQDYVASNELGYGKSFIRNLGKEKHDLAEKVMVTRLHLYGKWVKKCDHVEMYKRISDQNLELLRERLLETVVWPPFDDSNTE